MESLRLILVVNLIIMIFAEMAIADMPMQPKSVPSSVPSPSPTPTDTVLVTTTGSYQIIASIIGAIATIIAAYLGYRATKK